MDTLVQILKTPLNTILVIAGIAILFFAFFDVSKGTVTLRGGSWKAGLIPAVIGAVLLLVGLFYKPGGTAATIQPTAVPVALTEASVVVPSATPAPSDTPAPITAPTETAILPTLTASPIPVKALSENCISAQTWQVDSTDADKLKALSKDQNGCWNLNPLGFTVSGGNLNIIVSPSDTALASGIYTEISDHAVIKFNVSVSKFYLAYPNEPGYITFAVSPKSNPMTKNGSGRFKLQINDLGGSPLIYFILADAGEPNGQKLTTQHYLYGRSYDIRLEIIGLSMNIYINDSKKPVGTVNIPGDAKIFYIGYSIPLRASASAVVKGVNIDGQDK